MTTENTKPDLSTRDASHWAKPVEKLQVGTQGGAEPINVRGRHVVGPLQGFGQMWQKTYRIRLSGSNVSPAEVIKAWKAHFQDYWPMGNRFYGPITGIAPGEIGVISVGLGPMRLSTGVMVIYADDESFTFMTPEGHMFAGWITFSAVVEEGATMVEVRALIRANDPIYEMGFRLGFGHKAEDEFWHATLRNLGASFGIANGMVNQKVECIDSRMQWNKIGNIRHNAAIGTVLHKVTAPLRWAGKQFKK
jgi:hypothetical protein